MEYDLIVIGTGAASSPTARKCAKKGWKVAIIEKYKMGGTCANVGCNPKKFLYERAKLKYESEQMTGVNKIQFNWKETILDKRIFIKNLTSGSEKSYTDIGVDVYHGVASFTSKNTISIKNDNEEKEISGKYFVIGSGSKPRPTLFPGCEYLLTSTDFLDMEELPKDIVFIGGGYISFELAHIAKAAQANVTIIHRDSSPLKIFDKKVVNTLIKATEDAGIKLILDKEITSVEKNENKFTAKCKDFSIVADAMFHGAGRVPDIDELNLKQFGIEKLDVNEYLMVKGMENTYSGGDCIPGIPLLPVADYEGHIIAHNLLNESNKITPNYDVIPSVLFSYPPMASVGKKEGAYCVEGSMDSFTTNKRTNTKNTYAKVVFDENKAIIGAHIIAKNSGELINLFSEFIKNKKTKKDIMNNMDAYPTSTYDVRNIITMHPLKKVE